MKLLLKSMLCGAVLMLLSFAPVLQAQTYQVLLVGDSWAELMNYDNVLDENFAANGHPELHAKGDVTAVSGTKASEWATPAGLQAITDELDANSSIEVVQLIIGGNDFLAGLSGGGWYYGMGEPAQSVLFAQIVSDIETVIDHILAYDPDMEVVLSSYDYANFVESLSGINGANCTDYYNDLGMPTPEQVNTAGLDLEDVREAMVATKDRAWLVRNYGLMHWTFGYPSQSIPPQTLPLPGDISLPSPPEAMLLYQDCTHLNESGYAAVQQRLWDEFYADYLGKVFRDGFETGGASRWSP